MSICDKINELVSKFWHDEEEYYSKYYYDEDDKCHYISSDLTELFKSNNIVKYSIDHLDRFDSPAYECSFLAIAWIENNELHTYNILLEYM